MTVRPLRRHARVALLGVVVGLLLPALAEARPATLTGVVQLRTLDRPTRSVTQYVLRTPTGVVRLRRARGVRWVPASGQRVRVRGDRRGGVLTVRHVTRLARAKQLLGGTPVVGPRRVAVMLVNFEDETQQPFTAADLQSVWFGPQPSVSDFYAQTSYGQLTVTGQVFDWKTLPMNGSACVAPDQDPSVLDAWMAAAKSANGLTGTDFEHYVLVFPQVPACGTWAGWADVLGNGVWINGYDELAVMAHELGHNLGVEHAASLTCRDGATRVTVSGTCDAADEYGDPFEIMGTENTRGFDAFHRSQLGWLPAANEREATRGTFTLLSSSVAGSGIQSLRVPHDATQSLYVELRTPTAYEDYTGTTAAEGVLLHLGPTDYVSRTFTYLLDSTPGTDTFDDAALLPGGSVTDPVSGITVTLVSLGGGGATVRLDGGANTPPAAPTGLQAAIVPAGIALSWSPANDDTGIASYAVARDGTVIGTTGATSFTDNVVTPGTTVTYTVRATDLDGAAGPAATAVVTVPPADSSTPDDDGGAGTGGGGGGTPDAGGGATEDAGGGGAAAVGPTVPTRPGRLKVKRLTRTTALLTWRPARDDTAVAYYQAERDRHLLRRTSATRAVVLVTRYRSLLRVRAIDADGHAGRAAQVVVPRWVKRVHPRRR